MLAIERTRGKSSVMAVPTIIIGMDVSHGSPGQSDVPSIAAVTFFFVESSYKCCSFM